MEFDFNKLVEELRINASIEIGESISQPFFTPQGQIIKLHGEDVQVFEYGSEEEAKNEAMLVSADGSSVGTSVVTWKQTPHFYRSGRLIVLYVGNDLQVIETLTGLLGSQFAGS
jgi:hypothetical protein